MHLFCVRDPARTGSGRRYRPLRCGFQMGIARDRDHFLVGPLVLLQHGPDALPNQLLHAASAVPAPPCSSFRTSSLLAALRVVPVRLVHLASPRAGSSRMEATEAQEANPQLRVCACWLDGTLPLLRVTKRGWMSNRHTGASSLEGPSPARLQTRQPSSVPGWPQRCSPATATAGTATQP